AAERKGSGTHQHQPPCTHRWSPNPVVPSTTTLADRPRPVADKRLSPQCAMKGPRLDNDIRSASQLFGNGDAIVRNPHPSPALPLPRTRPASRKETPR